MNHPHSINPHAAGLQAPARLALAAFMALQLACAPQAHGQAQTPDYGAVASTTSVTSQPLGTVTDSVVTVTTVTTTTVTRVYHTDTVTPATAGHVPARGSVQVQPQATAAPITDETVSVMRDALMHMRQGQSACPRGDGGGLPTLYGDSLEEAGGTAAVAGSAGADTAGSPCGSVALNPYEWLDMNGERPRNAQGKIVLATIDPALLAERVTVGTDTVPIILPAPNYGRYDRGLFNFLFIPRGMWMFGLTASYGEFKSSDIQVLSLIKDFSFKGKMYSVQPTVSYFFRSNQSMGLKLNYSRGIADLGGLSVDFDDDMSFSLSDISYYSQTYTASVFYRNYVGLGADKRFALFNEIDLGFGSGSSRFKRSYDGQPRDTRTYTTKWGLNFSPGVTVFLMDEVCFNVSFGVFGLHVTHDRQYTDGADEGSRTSSGANFKFNLFNINFGLGVTI